MRARLDETAHLFRKVVQVYDDPVDLGLGKQVEPVGEQRAARGSRLGTWGPSQ